VLGPASEEEEQRFHGESSVSPLMAEVAASDSFAAAAQCPMSSDDGRLGCRVPGRGAAAAICGRSSALRISRLAAGSEQNKRVEIPC
jgi:hypothetical protein